MIKQYVFLRCFCFVLLFLIYSSISAQDKRITGEVISETGEELIGVVVAVKNTTNGTATDHKGKFSLEAPMGSILKISFMGYVSQEIEVKSDFIKVILKEDQKMLEEVIVVGYGSVKKSDLTGSISSVKVSDLKDIPSNSIENLLQGRSAGLHVISNSQDPGAGSTIRIRGGSSLRGSNAPLIVVDGFPLGDAGNLKQINPADIVSVEILKDASASSIYGSRGANGVIMVTTRKADKGKTIVNVKQQLTFSQFSSEFIQWKDMALMAQLDNEAKINGNMYPLYVGGVGATGIYYPSVEEIQNGTWPHHTDWADVVFRDISVSNITSVSLNSSTESTSYNINASYLDQNGVNINDNYKKATVGFNVRHEVSKNFKINSISNFSKDWRNNNSGLAYWRNPLWPVFNEDGSYFLNGSGDYDHPLAWTDYKINKNNGTDFITSLILDWQIYKDLNLKSHGNYKYGASISDRFNPAIYTENGTNNNGAAFLDNWTGNNYTVETYLTYDKIFTEKHHINAMAGHSYEYTQARTSNLESYDFKNGSLGNENMGSGDPEKNIHRNSQTITKLLSYMGRINYTFDNKYLLTLTMRTDGSSKFGDSQKWAYFPSGAVSWKVHHEDFIKNLNIFDELKIRVSYGISGNQGISPYQTLSRYGIENFYNGSKWNTSIGPGYIIGNTGVGWRYKVWGGIPNKDLKWETTSQANLGLDLAFFSNRLKMTFDYYDKSTSDLLRERFLPLSSGYDRMWVNDGEISNKGFEFSADAIIVDTKDWGLSGTFIFSKNKNKVVSLGNAVDAGLSTDYLSGFQYEYFGGGLGSFRETSPNILAVGLPVNVFYGYKVNGIVQSDREGAAAGLTGAESKAGEFKYVDLSEDGVFNTNDRTVIGDPNPDFMMSMNLSARYKNFDASIFFNGVFGHDILWEGMNTSAMYAPLRWTPDNPTSEFPSARQGRYYYLSDWFIKDGSFLRIQNLNLGYTIKPQSKWISSVRCYLNIENLHTFTKFKGYDPEVGLDGRYGGGYPKLRKFTLGLDFTF